MDGRVSRTGTRPFPLGARERGRKPLLAVDKPYRFEGPQGALGLANLFGGKLQLVVNSAFVRDADGAACQSYSCFARGLDMLNPAYNLPDVTPLGRQEESLPLPMSWVKLHDE